MIEKLLGFTLLILSLITFSALHNAESRMFNLKRFAMYTLLFVIVFALQGITGLLVLFNCLDIVYHIVCGFSLILIVEIMATVCILRTLKSFGDLHVDREGFNCLIYACVLTMIADKVAQFFVEDLGLSRFILITTVTSITIILLCLGIYLLKVYKDLINLTETVNLVPPLKTVCSSFSIYAICEIVKGFYEYTSILLLTAHLVLFTGSLQLLWDFAKKYYIPLKEVKI